MVNMRWADDRIIADGTGSLEMTFFLLGLSQIFGQPLSESGLEDGQDCRRWFDC